MTAELNVELCAQVKRVGEEVFATALAVAEAVKTA